MRGKTVRRSPGSKIRPAMFARVAQTTHQSALNFEYLLCSRRSRISASSHSQNLSTVSRPGELVCSMESRLLTSRATPILTYDPLPITYNFRGKARFFHHLHLELGDFFLPPELRKADVAHRAPRNTDDTDCFRRSPTPLTIGAASYLKFRTIEPKFYGTPQLVRIYFLPVRINPLRVRQIPHRRVKRTAIGAEEQVVHKHANCF